MEIRQAFTFDDVLLTPAASSVLPNETDTRARLTREVELGIPLISAAMDTVTESALAIAMAQAGGLGVIHRNMTIEKQADEVRKVKKFEAGMVVNPVTIHPDETLADALRLMADHKISGIPVVERGNGRLAGILTNRDVRFATDPKQRGLGPDDQGRARHGDRDRSTATMPCAFSISIASRSCWWSTRPIAASASSPSRTSRRRSASPTPARTSTGACAPPPRPAPARTASRAPRRCSMPASTCWWSTPRTAIPPGSSNSVKRIRRLSNYTQIIAGNIATAEGARALIEAGADAVKVGIGPGSICTTRIVAGVGVPQLTAILDAVEECRKSDVPVIADGGIKFSGDLAKAIAAGADCAMLGSLFAGTDEAPGEVFLYQGRTYKSYRGMGSVGAMARGSADRYFQQEVTSALKLVPEGVEGRVAA